MRILILNVGSSSIKYSLFENKDLIDNGIVERIGERKGIKNFDQALKLILARVRKFDLIGHRVVHGGEINKTCFLNDEVIKELKKVRELAPLHDFPELKVIDLCKRFNVKQVAVFDTSFFKDLPKVTQTYAIPHELTKKFNIRRYGFHGESHKYMYLEAARLLKKKNIKVITCHLGNGCSISAIKNGKAIDTSMGFTPLEGLVMGTRSGNIDLGIIFYLLKHGFSLEKLYDILNNESGLLGISGKSKDVRDLLKSKNKRARLALNIFVYNIIKYIGAYHTILKGADAIVFTAGIGENEWMIRKAILDNLSFLGIKLDYGKNTRNEEMITKNNSKIKVFVVRANEEEIMIKEILKLCQH